MLKSTPFIVCLSLLFLFQPARAQDENQTLELFAAYQSGYLQVVAVSCFQLYSSSGIVSSDYLSGYISGSEAQDAMTHNRLLLSVCMTTLDDVQTRTPAADREAHSEMNRLRSLLTALDGFMSAADEFFINQNQDTADRADAAQTALDQAMEEYAGPENSPG